MIFIVISLYVHVVHNHIHKDFFIFISRSCEEPILEDNKESINSAVQFNKVLMSIMKAGSNKNKNKDNNILLKKSKKIFFML